MLTKSPMAGSTSKEVVLCDFQEGSGSVVLVGSSVAVGAVAVVGVVEVVIGVEPVAGHCWTRARRRKQRRQRMDICMSGAVLQCRSARQVDAWMCSAFDRRISRARFGSWFYIRLQTRPSMVMVLKLIQHSLILFPFDLTTD